MRFKLTCFALTAALFLALGLSLERPLYAYVDPGSSLLIFQTISAVVTGTLFYFRRRMKELPGKSSAGSNNNAAK
jgi:hypothetical protein